MGSISKRGRGKVSLSTSLVVGDAFCLGSAGALGGKGQNHEGDQVGQHVVDQAGNVQRQQEVKAGVHIAQCAAETE